MADVIARIKIKGKNYETLVDVDKALQFKKNGGNIDEVIKIDKIFTDSKKGFNASPKDLEEAFGTSDIREAAGKIIKQGEIQIPKEHRDEEREQKKKRIIDFLARNAMNPQTNNPYPADMLSSMIDKSGISIDNRPIEQQINSIIKKIKETLPLKIQGKKLRLKIPAEHTGKVYGLLQDYKENEKWLGNGDLEAEVNVPIGLIDDFYDKLNSVTHGSVMSEELKENDS